MQVKVDSGTLPDNDKLTLGAWLNRWLEVIAPSIEPHTLGGYTRLAKQYLIPRLGAVKLAKLRPADVEKLFADLLRDKVSAAMVRKIGTALSISLNHAIRSQLILFNPARGVRRPKATKPDIKVLGAADAAKLVKASAGEPLGTLFVLLLDSGMRPGEAFALLWSDVDLVAGRVTVTKTLEQIGGEFRVKATKTGRSNRSVDLSANTVRMLLEHRKELLRMGLNPKPASLVFCSPEGGYVTRNRGGRDLQDLLTRQELPQVSLYGLRHTSATLLLLANVNPKVVSERLGHSSIVMTLDTYSHVLPSMGKAAADVMEKLLTGSI